MKRFDIKIASQIFILGFILLLIFLIPLYIFSVKEIFKIKEKEIIIKANILADDIEKLILEKVKIVTTLANSNIIKKSLEKSNNFYNKLSFNDRDKLINSLNKKWILTKNIKDPFILKYTNNEVANYLKIHEKIFPEEYGEIFLTNKYGALVASTSKLTTFKHNHKKWWIGAFNKGKGAIFLDDRGYDESAKTYVLGIVVPIKDNKNNIIGILKANIKILGGISSILESHKKRKFIHIKLIRSKGRIIYCYGMTPLIDKVNKEIIANIANKVFGSFFHNNYLIGFSIIDFNDPKYKVKFGGTKATIDHKFGNEGEDWYILIYCPKAKIYSHLNNFTKLIFIIGLCIVLILAIFSYLIGKETVIPIKRMIRICKRIAKGNFKTKIKVNRDDEIGALAATINEMAEQLDLTTTSKKLLEEEIEKRIQAESKLRDLLLVSPVVIYELDYDTLQFKWVSENSEKLLGFTAREIIENEFLFPQQVHEDDRFIYYSIEDIYSQKKILREYRFFKKDGNMIWLHDEAILIEGDKERIIGAITDFTLHKKMTKEIYEKEQKFKILFENFFEGVLILKDEKIIDCNITATKIFECNKKFLIGKTLKDISNKYDEKYNEFKRYLKRAKLKKSEIFLWEFKKYNGTQFFAEIALSYLTLDDEEFLILSFRDITEKIKYEENLRQVAKLEAIGSLTSGIAHDFNNILTIISGSIEIALQSLKTNTKVVEKSLKNAMDAVERATNLIYKLLAFSRKQTIFPKPINLISEIKELEGLLKKLIFEDIDLKFEYKNDNIIIFFDKSQLEQILVNLVVNARDAVQKSNKKNKEIIVKVEKILLNQDNPFNLNKGEYAKISVMDNGIGMPKEILDRIFEPFFTTKKMGEGTGLGLSTVHGIVYQNKGAINVISEVGKGSTFEIFLPVYKELQTIKKENIIKADIPTGKNETILVIEDEPVVREILKLMLESLGYNLIVASNGKEALNIFKDRYNEIDLIISDIIMPEMDGKILFDEMLKITPDVKILYISGYPDNILTAKGIDIRGDNFIPKPVTLEILAKKIREILSK